MINYIYVDRSGHKKARPVRNRKEYFAIRNTEANVRNYQQARQGDKKAKMRLKQFNYNDLLPNGVLKGCCHAASTFAHDIDCGDEEKCKKIAQTLLEKKEEIGLLELTVSSGWGLHAICRRQQGKTILENQVRLSLVTQTEMDTSAHDVQRVMFTGPATDDVLIYLDDAIFEESLSVEESAAEFERLKEREKQGREDVPAEAKKVNKHFRPWDCTLGSGPEVKFEAGDCTLGSGPQAKSQATSLLGQTPASSQSLRSSDNPCNPCQETLSFKGMAYSEIVEEWWKRNGGVPQEGERNVKLYQLAVNLRAICDNNKTLLLQVMPRLGLDEQELQSIVESACKEPPKEAYHPFRNEMMYPFFCH